MVRSLTPVRIARASRQSVQSSAEETELDFQLALKQGLLIHAVEFSIGDARFVAAADDDEEDAFMSLHAETDELEDSYDEFGDGLVLNSEVFAETALHVSSSSTSGEQTGPKYTWFGPISWRFRELLGEPLLLASNVTFRVVTTANSFTVNSAVARIFYQYVELTEQELARQFLLKR